MLIGCMLSFIQDMWREVTKLFGPRAVLFISSDEKAKVPLGFAAATLQAPLLMHLEYKVKLPDYSFVVATRHKLNPSVYGVCDVNLKGEVTYSGDTFIQTRSEKHDKSSAETHAYDMHKFFRSERMAPKPILLMETDSAQDEAPRYPKPLATVIFLFKELKLDALLHDVSGIILFHDYFGNHLDTSGKTKDIKLEKKNFFKK